MKKIKLTKGKYAIVDSNNYCWLNQWKWYFSHKYAMRDTNKGRIYMHRLVCKTIGNKEVDHINRNTLDNRKSNLRSVTRSFNKFNTGLWKHNTSGFKGVSLFKRDNMWHAQIKINRKALHLGYFKEIQDAIDARKEAEVKVYAS